jgi:hypothetical protein
LRIDPDDARDFGDIVRDFERYVRAHPPRCLASLSARPLRNPKGGLYATVGFTLSSRHGDTLCRVLAYDLKDLDPSYRGDTVLLSPITLKWKGGQAKQVVFDAAKHGYHCEAGSTSAKWTGGKRHRQTIPVCSSCEGEWFSVKAIFEYRNVFEVMEDEEVEHPEDWFQAVTFRCGCQACGHVEALEQDDL